VPPPELWKQLLFFNFFLVSLLPFFLYFSWPKISYKPTNTPRSKKNNMHIELTFGPIRFWLSRGVVVWFQSWCLEWLFAASVELPLMLFWLCWVPFDCGRWCRSGTVTVAFWIVTGLRLLFWCCVETVVWLCYWFVNLPVGLDRKRWTVICVLLLWNSSAILVFLSVPFCVLCRFYL